MEIPVYKIDNGECPYLDDLKWESRFFQLDTMPEELYEHLLSEGWRRSGSSFYKNCCEGCNECIPIRVNVNEFKPSKSQRKCLNKNKDVTIEIEPASFREEDYELSQKYDNEWHDSKMNMDVDTYFLMNVETPVNTQMMRYFIDGKVVGLGWIDVLPGSISSVYFSFDPDYSERSLGVFSMLKEIELCKKMGKTWLHTGFYIEGCKKMNYKSKYKPYQLLKDGSWIDRN